MAGHCLTHERTVLIISVTRHYESGFFLGTSVNDTLFEHSNQLSFMFHHLEIRCCIFSRNTHSDFCRHQSYSWWTDIHTGETLTYELKYDQILRGGDGECL